MGTPFPIGSYMIANDRRLNVRVFMREFRMTVRQIAEEYGTITPEGKLDRSIPVPAKKPAMCAFGGPDLATLFVTSIRPPVDASEHDGHVFALRPGVCGLPEPEYAGVL